MKFSVIACIYNAAPLVRQCLEALLARTTEDPTSWELILVDNHGPDQDAHRYIWDLHAKNPNPAKHLYVTDPGKNLGCHEGWNFGYRRTKGEYVVKLDDDTIIQTDGWLTKMAEALERIPHLAYISADIDAKQANNYAYIKDGDLTIEVPQNKGAVVGFSCVMFRRKDIERWGPMKANYRAAGGKHVNAERLYGGEEAYYAMMARDERRLIAHFPAVFCHHLSNEERHPDYAAWKRAYGFHAWTDKEMKDWIAAGEHVESYTRFIALEVHQQTPNDALLVEWVRRLGTLGTQRIHANTIATVPFHTKNGVVLEACAKAIKEIEERIK